MSKPAILIIGTFLYDENTPFPQAKLLSDLLENEGYKTTCISGKKNKVLRLIDICLNIVKSKDDYIFVQIFSGPAYIYAAMAILLGKIYKKNVVGVLRGGNLPKYLKKNKWLKIFILKLADTLISPSGYMHSELIKVGLNTKVIPNIVNLDAYFHKRRAVVKPRILWIRRYIDIYNPLMAINVAEKVKEQLGCVQLTMAGGGDNQWIINAAHEKGLDQNVEILGFVSKEEINSLGQKHDIFINTANIDNFPVTVVEAMALGLLVVSTNVGGIPYLLKHGENALLVNADDCDEMANQIIQLCKDSKQCLKISDSSHQLVSGFSWGEIRKKYMDIFS